MATTRDQIVKLFADFFSKQLNQPFNENTKIRDVDGFDSLAMVDLSIEFEDTFNSPLNLDTFKGSVYLKDVIDAALKLGN